MKDFAVLLDSMYCCGENHDGKSQCGITADISVYGQLWRRVYSLSASYSVGLIVL